MLIWKFCPFFIRSSSTYANIQEYLGRIPPEYKKGHFLIVSLSVYPRSRRGAERVQQGEGRRSRRPKTALERSNLTENSRSANRILRPIRKKNNRNLASYLHNRSRKKPWPIGSKLTD